MALLSIVLPAYNEEQNIANTAKVLGELLDQNGIDYELVFISDGSKDNTYAEIQKAAAQNPRIKGAEFSRNFGKEAGIFAGLELTSGDAVIVMDCDLQHPPQVIPEMWKKWKDGRGPAGQDFRRMWLSTRYRREYMVRVSGPF